MVDDPCPNEVTWFAEFTECTTLISCMLSTNIYDESTVIETTANQLIKIFEKYQEQPFLLDKHLEEMIDPIIKSLQTHVISSTINPQISHLFRVLYILTKVRGYKTVLRFFSHEATEFEFILNYISIIPPNEGYWETRYVLLLWLSLVVMIPFDLNRVDMSDDQSIIQRTLTQMKVFLNYPSKESEAAGLVIAKLITRKDVVDHSMISFLDYCSNKLTIDNPFTMRSILSCIAQVLKTGQRELLLPFADHIFKCIESIPSDAIETNSLSRKYLAKINQRLALCFLKPRVATWRYQRGNRSLNKNIGSQQPQIHEEVIEEDDEMIVVDEAVEGVIGSLMEGLQDRDTIVRWSCAKGVGRVTERLPKEFAQEVIEGVLDLFMENVVVGEGEVMGIESVSDSTWHGGCLALAEFARRGLLLPEKLVKVIPWVALALKFDQRRGSHSVGSHVRDAACYVCWSFARAYAPDIMSPFVHILAKELVIVSVFDREVNIRRASSASFQENVGRQGIFPNGIDIIVIADYIAVGNRVNAYLDVAKQIGQFEEYRVHLINHVARSCVGHWDKVIRELASKSLAVLCPLDPEYIFNSILPELVTNSISLDLNIRHGSLLALGEVCNSLSRIFSMNDSNWFIQPRRVEIVKSVLAVTAQQDKLNTFGSELLRYGCCKFISGLTQSGWPLNDMSFYPAGSDLGEVIDVYWELIYSTLERKEEWLQKHACESLRAFSGWMEGSGLERGLDGYMGKLVGVVERCKSGNAKRGFVLALSYLSGACVERHWEVVLSCVISVADLPVNKVDNDAEVRRNAIISLTGINVVLGRRWAILSKVDYERVMACFIRNMNDYTIDSRGDVGSWIREACFVGCYEVLGMMLAYHPEYSSEELNARVVGCLLKQSVEKIDRTREAAGNVLLNIVLGSENGLFKKFKCDDLDALRSILSGNVNWLRINDLYPVMVEILHIESYRSFILEGFSLSVGGLSETLVRNSSFALVKFVKELPKTQIIAHGRMGNLSIMETFLQLLAVNVKNDRVSNSLLETLYVLLSGGVFEESSIGFLALSDRLFVLLKAEVLKSKDIKKLSCAIKVACGVTSYLLEHNETVRVKKCMLFLTNYLFHPFPMIRRMAAEELYLILINEEKEGKEELDDILLTTEWNEPLVAGLKLTVNGLVDRIFI